MPSRLTRIVATIGPATASRAAIARLIAAGMDVARLNFSHGTLADHAAVLKRIRAAARAAGRPIAVMQDLQGPRIRVGRLPGGAVTLRAGEAVRVTRAWTSALDVTIVPVAPAALIRAARPGERLLIRDGTVELRVERAGADGLRCEVVRGGPIFTGSGVNVPDTSLPLPALTAKDKVDLAAGARIGFDAVALSFVRDAADIRRTRDLLRRAGSQALVIAKIERAEALANLDEILAQTDGVIVARGDLGVECPAESVPLVQKDIIRRAQPAGAFVVIATHMLESMTHAASPTRAEVSDVANAVLDGADGVMLSGETAIGDYPTQAVATMDKILRAVECGPARAATITTAPASPERPDDFLAAVARAGVELAQRSGAAALVPFTVSGRTARLVAATRPQLPILALTPDDGVARRFALWRGVHAHRLPLARTLDALFERGVRALVAARAVRRGDVLVLIGGSALAPGSANTLKVTRVESTARRGLDRFERP